MESKRLNIFTASKTGTIGINWSQMSYDKTIQEECLGSGSGMKVMNVFLRNCVYMKACSGKKVG